MKQCIILLSFFLIVTIFACNDIKTGTSNGSSGTVDSGTDADNSKTISLTISASTTTVIISGTSTITVNVKDSAGVNVADGTSVTFAVDDATLGSITSEAKTTDGNATATFTASTITGTSNITATSGTQTKTLSITIQTAAATITLTAAPGTITVAGTSTISATVKDVTDANVPDGTSVFLSLSSTVLGSITTQATTSSGNATATFTALTTPGTVTVTVSSGAATSTAAIVIEAADLGSIEYSSASPQVVGLKGSGQAETSLVIFLVKDINGNSVVDGTKVTFVLAGPSGGKLPANGGEFIGNLDTTPTTATASTVGGSVTVTMNAGAVSGPVTIIASVSDDTRTISSSSSVISIGGGVPSATHFNLSESVHNLPGLAISNSQSTITAFLADRFGNYNVLKGTSVSFYTEAGAIGRSGVTDEAGIASTILRTQAPAPAEVAISAGETTTITGLNATYSLTLPVDGTYHPRDGWVTILATVQGEEAFEDANANGLYDTGETFIDLGEPFIDKNDDGTRDDGTSDPFEEFVDINGDGSYDTPNGVWDGPGCAGTGCQRSKMIWVQIKPAFTGNASNCTVSPSTFTITNGGSQSFTFMVGDENLNALIAGTTITVTASKGTLSGQISNTVKDYRASGPFEISFTLSDPDTDTTVEPSSISINVSSSVVGGCERSVSGTVQ